MLTVAHDQDIESGDRITTDGRVFAVLGVDGGRSWDLCRRAALAEVRDA
jgi:hypothetical protein